MRRRVVPAPRYAEGVSVRLTGALVAALALLSVLPSVAAADLSRGAQRVYDDYRDDAALTPCDHSIKTYRRTLREITPDIEEETPAFRPAVEAALRERESKQPCTVPGSGEQDPNAQPGTSGSTPVSPPASVQPAQPAPAQPAKPAKPVQPIQPIQPAPAQPAKPAPTATPTPTVAPAAPVTSSAPAPASAPVLLDRPHHGTPVGLLIALGLLALCLLAIPLALLARAVRSLPGRAPRVGRGRLPGRRHVDRLPRLGAGGPLKEQLPWWIGGPVLGLCVVAIRGLLNARLGVTGAFSEVIDRVGKRSLAFDWRGWFFFGLIAGGLVFALDSR